MIGRKQSSFCGCSNTFTSAAVIQPVICIGQHTLHQCLIVQNSDDAVSLSGHCTMSVVYYVNVDVLFKLVSALDRPVLE